MIMEPTVNGNVETFSHGEQAAPRTNIFGMSIEPPTDLETSAPNLNSGIRDTIPPVSFNPFGAQPVQTSLDTNVFATPEMSDQIETFDMFGDVIDPNQIVMNQSVEDTFASKKNIGDQINTVRNTIKQVESDGFMVEMEEYDFEDMYQMIIKIKK